MLRSNEIADLMAQPFTALQRGRALAMSEREQKYSSNGTARTRKFLAEFAAVDLPRRDAYNHPGAGHLPLRKPGPLTPVEMAWLQRLPQDPSQITFDDAKALASISNTVSSTKHPADKRLIDAAWVPVREMHDRNAAAVHLRNVGQPPPRLPDALGAMADAVAAENTQLEPDDAITRAGRVLQDAAAMRAARRERDILNAQGDLERLSESVDRRTAVTL